MKYIKNIRLLILITGIVTVINACQKTAVTKPIGDDGKTYLKIIEAPENQLYFSPFSDIKTIDLFSARKDANSSASLNINTKANLKSLPALIDTFNDHNGTFFEMLPDSLFVINNSAITKTATGYSIDFKPGSFANEFTIGLNGAKWDVSHTYALAFALSSGDSVTVIPSLDTIIVFLSVKNKYDGKYTATGSMVDGINAALSGFYPWECEFRTSGPNSVQIYDPFFDAIYHAIKNGADRSVYGAFGLEITFDPVTDAVISITNVYSPAPNTRDALLDNANTYYWNSSNKSLDVKYYMTQKSLVPVAPHIRTTFIENFKYTGPR
jgi:hypothetical protein